MTSGYLLKAPHVGKDKLVYKDTHYIEVPLEAPGILMFVQKIVQANAKKPCVKGFTVYRFIPHTNGNVKNISIPWWHDDLCYLTFAWLHKWSRSFNGDSGLSLYQGVEQIYLYKYCGQVYTGRSDKCPGQEHHGNDSMNEWITHNQYYPHFVEF